MRIKYTYKSGTPPDFTIIILNTPYPRQHKRVKITLARAGCYSIVMSTEPTFLIVAVP